ncbi:MAG TPA: hypothetical protein VFL69_03895 [Marmoricola sp.]|nr:hypothetical protein [Marmoricola sp.]
MVQHHPHRTLQAGWGNADPEDTVRWRRVVEHLEGTECSCEQIAGGRRALADSHVPVLRFSQALLVAHDLYMLGRLKTPPSLRWTVADADAALRPWNVVVVPDDDTTPDA